jgi:hypothetical protein
MADETVTSASMNIGMTVTDTKNGSVTRITTRGNAIGNMKWNVNANWSAIVTSNSIGMVLVELRVGMTGKVTTMNGGFALNQRR